MAAWPQQKPAIINTMNGILALNDIGSGFLTPFVMRILPKLNSKGFLKGELYLSNIDILLEMNSETS